MKVASTKLTNPEWETLHNKCNERGVTIAEYLRELLRTGDNSTVATPPQESPIVKDSEMKRPGLFRLLSARKNKNDNSAQEPSYSNDQNTENGSPLPSIPSTSDSDLVRHELAEYTLTMRKAAEHLSEISKGLKEQRQQLTKSTKPVQRIPKLSCDSFTIDRTSLRSRHP